MLLDLLQSDGFSPKKKTANEYASPCPGCGGDDRFVIFVEQDKYWCRGCDATGDAIQYLRIFHKMSFPDAAAAVGKQLSPNRRTAPAPAKDPAPTPEKVQPAEWLAKVERFIAWAHKKLMENGQVLEWLRLERGITGETAARFQLGWLDHNVFQPKQDWGMQQDGKKFFIPSGLVIPWQGRRARIRRDNPGEFGRYFVLAGSASDPFLVGDPQETTAIIVESELDAILLAQELSRKIFIVAIGSASIKPTAELMERLSMCPVVLVCLDTDDAGAKAAKWWLNNTPSSFRTMTPAPFGKDITEAFLHGLNLNEWLSVSLEMYLEEVLNINPTEVWE